MWLGLGLLIFSLLWIAFRSLRVLERDGASSPAGAAGCGCLILMFAGAVAVIAGIVWLFRYG
jgi:hypothetical protein